MVKAIQSARNGRWLAGLPPDWAKPSLLHRMAGIRNPDSVLWLWPAWLLEWPTSCP